jgi:protein involved in polysaccharide export with SLBB domain
MSATLLELGEIIRAEIRDPSGAVSSFSHDYPIDPSSLLRMPSLIPIPAVGQSLATLQILITNSLVNGGIFTSPTVNLALLNSRVDFLNRISPGDRLFVRVLATDGSVDPSSGAYTVDGAGFINFPFVGGIPLQAALLFEAEQQIGQGLIDQGIFPQPFVNVTRVQLM